MRPTAAIAVRTALALGAWCVASPAPAQTTAIQDVSPRVEEPRPIEDRRLLPGQRGKNGAAQWNTELARQVYVICPGAALVGAMEHGAGMDEASARQKGNCALHTLFVRNDSTTPVQCRASLAYPAPDLYNESRWEVDRVIYPSQEEAVVRSWANDTNKPTNWSASCSAIPATLAPLNTPPACRPKLSGPDPGDFYPATSQRLNESGGVVLEFTATSSAELGDVRVAASSGFVSLDNAALDYSRHVRAVSGCVGQRLRFKVKFTLKDSPPALPAPVQ